MMTASAVTIAGATLFSTASAYAQNNSGQYPPLVTKLAQKFGLNEAEVKAVFDEEMNSRHTQMQVKIQEKLTQAVADGKITEAQKTAIIAKHTEMQANREANRIEWQSMTPEQRREAMEELKQEMKTWAEQNGINLSYLPGWNKGPFGGRRGGMWRF